ncbi:helix-turn-helix domain-containing protein [Dyadobacter sp. NIV53]|uniref:helix-turn-helix domain-containing protein n=1 Tax=Dyadobacter sp. NIV53 TaxID=2861765 RepID=UPI001C88190B|nr:helix-turn-helix domain-containing protein [Dyadobacter sp. NIV53]
MNAGQIQHLLFQEIREQIPRYVSLADSVAELLEISADSAYRRIRGEKPITLEELQKLSVHYNLSVDRLLHLHNKSFIFQGHLMDENDYDIEKWLVNLSQIIQYVKIQPQHHIYYLAKDVPFVYPLQFPALAAFKDFFRRRSLMPPNQTRGIKFSVSDINPSFSETAARIVSIYNTIPSTEIWSSESFNSILKQIQFYHYTSQFASDRDTHYLFDTIEVMINHLEHQAEIGVKYTYGEKPEKGATSYNLFNNELFIGEDTILADLGENKITFLNHSFINYMTTMDEAFCGYTFKAIKNIISRSTPVSWSGEKGRKMFFNGLKKRLEEARKLK